MSTALPTFIKQKDWLPKNADEIRRIAQLKFEANLERHAKKLAERGR
jgi:hypothetical protein